MSRTVLIVDDSKLARMSAGKVLAALQPTWTKIEATNADEALQKVKQEKVHVALVDFNMPGRDGLSLAADIRAVDREIAIAIISANHQQEVISRATEIGAVFLSKPVTEQLLRPFLEDSGRHAKREP